MRKQGFRESTCRYAVQVLNSVNRHASLLDPETVKEYLAKATFSEARKERVSHDLARFYKWKGIPFEKPRYRKVKKLPFIPLETEVDQLIGGMGKKTACLLQLLRETGMRCGEASAAKWTDIDYERSTIVVQPEKHGRSRILRISGRLIAMLNQLPKGSPCIFHTPEQDPISSLHHARRNFERQRKQLAVKLQNPRLLWIHMHTLRHLYATKTYHQTKDILHVMRQLGHTNIVHTLTYTHLVDFPSEEFVCKVAKTVKEASELVEAGFNYVCDVEGYKLFRKRK